MLWMGAILEKIQTRLHFTPRNSTKLLYPSEMLRPKTWFNPWKINLLFLQYSFLPLEILYPHPTPWLVFFWNSPFQRPKTKTQGNSMSFSENPWNFYFFFNWPLEFPNALIFFQNPCLDFFWNSPNARMAVKQYPSQHLATTGRNLWKKNKYFCILQI